MIQEREGGENQNALSDSVSEARHCRNSIFFHILFLKGKNLSPAHTESKWNSVLTFEERRVKESVEIF